MATYTIDKIRQIAVWDTGEWYNISASSSFVFSQVDAIQECKDSILYNGRRYPVIVIGNEQWPILQSKYIESDIVKEVIIPYGIKRVGCNAFSDELFSDSTLELPESLLEIGDEAFLKSGIKKIVIPENVVHVGKNVFSKDTEVECHSPHLIRCDDNSFKFKTYQFKGCTIEFRITDPIRREVSACRYLDDAAYGLVFPDVVTIEGKEYLVTGIDSDFCEDIYYDVVLPAHLRKIGNRVFYWDYVSLQLPETLTFLGNEAIYLIDKSEKKALLHIPRSLRFIGKENIVSKDAIVNHSPFIDIDRQFVLDDMGNPLFYYGKDMEWMEEYEFYKKIRKEATVEQRGDSCQVEAYDYQNYPNGFADANIIDSCTF